MRSLVLFLLRFLGLDFGLLGIKCELGLWLQIFLPYGWCDAKQWFNQRMPCAKLGILRSYALFALLVPECGRRCFEQRFHQPCGRRTAFPALLRRKLARGAEARVAAASFYIAKRQRLTGVEGGAEVRVVRMHL